MAILRITYTETMHKTKRKKKNKKKREKGNIKFYISTRSRICNITILIIVAQW